MVHIMWCWDSDWFCGLWCGMLLAAGWVGEFEVFVSLIRHNRLIWPYL